jgi:hypothetical protein
MIPEHVPNGKLGQRETKLREKEVAARILTVNPSELKDDAPVANAQVCDDVA